jgi:phenylpropionate dioxygenase-like ring-hydroxylating dioxygenase large terminal subunit
MPETVLRHYWHPAATSAELTDQPLAVTLLDERIVLWRAGGQAVAFKDLCIHRGSALSLGSVQGENLVCGYHGWEYCAGGDCVRIPALAPEQPIPRKARAVAVYAAAERYGLIWLCLDDPWAPLPEFPEVEDPSYHTFYFGDEIWETSAARMIENFIDTSHFPFVHAGLNASPENPRLADFAVEQRGDELTFATEFAPLAREQFAGPAALADLEAFTGGRRRYRVIAPFAAQAIRPMADGQRQLISIVASPLSERRMRRFSWSSRNFGFDKPDAVFREIIQRVVAQDRRMVESQRPEELPLDLSEELHLRGPDTGTLAYRRLLAELGRRPAST